MEAKIVGGVVTGGGGRGIREVHQHVTALAVGMLADSLARTPRVYDGRVVARCDVVRERVVLRAGREAGEKESAQEGERWRRGSS